MNIFKKLIQKFNRKPELPNNMVLIDASELADLRLRALDQATAKPMSPEQLTRKALGSYEPNFEMLATKTDAFKNEIGLMCANLLKSEAWKYLITHLKQDQVNLSLFTEGVRHDDPWVRGSINGIYIVDDQITTLGTGYIERENAGLVGKKKANAKTVKA